MPRKSGSASGSGGRSGAPRKKSWNKSQSGGKGNPVGAKKSLGQHFLRDQGVVDAIVGAAHLTRDDTVLEIGPGPGILTGRLVEQAGRVVAVELDDRFAAALLARYADSPRVAIVHADILEVDPVVLVGQAVMPTTPHLDPLVKEREQSADRVSTPNSHSDATSTPHPDSLLKERGQGEVRWKAVANIPYYITSPILRHLLEASVPPELAVIMVQKEVAERICAQPGDLSLLAVSVQYYATPELLFAVPASAFQPPPKVDSAVVRLTPHTAPLFPDVPTERYFEMVRAGFSQRRKQLANSLSAGLQRSKAEVVALLAAADIDPERRAETLTLEEWATICRRGMFAEMSSPSEQSTGVAH